MPKLRRRSSSVSPLKRMEHLCRRWTDLKLSARFCSPGCGDKVVGCRGAEFLAIRDADSERRWCGLQRAKFQSRTCQAIERLRNHSNASTRFDRRDEAGDAVVFFNDLRRAVQRCKQVGNPSLMLWIVRKGESNETLFGDLFQSDSARSRQWVRRMHYDAN